ESIAHRPGLTREQELALADGAPIDKTIRDAKRNAQLPACVDHTALVQRTKKRPQPAPRCAHSAEDAFAHTDMSFGQCPEVVTQARMQLFEAAIESLSVGRSWDGAHPLSLSVS